MLKSSVPAMLQIHTVCVYFDEKLSRVSKSLKTFGKTKKGSFNNYVDKKREVGVNGKSTMGHVTKGSFCVKIIIPQLSTPGGGGGQNWVKFDPRNY